MAKPSGMPPVGRDTALGIPGPVANEIFANQPLAKYDAGHHPVDGSVPSITMPPFPPTK